MKKMLGDERRKSILSFLKASEEPISGSELAKRTNVSRQVIVQDVSLLRATNAPVISTPQGYLYVSENTAGRPRRVIACQHTKRDAEKELNTLVDYGVSVLDVIVEHPIYGEITGSLHLNNRFDVEKFIKRLGATNAMMLSGLTNGIHLHTIEADTEEQLSNAIEALNRLGILVQ